MKRKRILDWIVPVGFVLVGIFSIVISITNMITFDAGYFGKGEYPYYKTYGGDAYTGIQNAAVDTARNVYILNESIATLGGCLAETMTSMYSIVGYIVLIAGLVILLYGISKVITVIKQNKLVEESNLLQEVDSTK